MYESQAQQAKRKDFEQQAMPHVDALFGAAVRLARNPRDAEDLVQEAMLRAYRFWGTFEPGTNCKAWLLRIVTNTFLNEYQRKKRSREILDAANNEQQATDGVLIQGSADRFAAPDRALMERSVSDDVQKALDALPDDFRIPVVLCDMQGLSYKEIAEAMDCPVGTVMSRLFRGRKLLAHALASYAKVHGFAQPTPANISQETTVSLDAFRRRRKGGTQ
jgi:RNA polymerase sigma-70 factor, ECF subfamily